MLYQTFHQPAGERIAHAFIALHCQTVPSIFCLRKGKRSGDYSIASHWIDLIVVVARLRCIDARIEPFAFARKPVWAMNNHSGRCQFEAK
jgi:hypothetical protein